MLDFNSFTLTTYVNWVMLNLFSEAELFDGVVEQKISNNNCNRKLLDANRVAILKGIEREKYNLHNFKSFFYNEKENSPNLELNFVII